MVNNTSLFSIYTSVCTQKQQHEYSKTTRIQYLKKYIRYSAYR